MRDTRPEPGTIMDDDQLEELAQAAAGPRCLTCRFWKRPEGAGPGHCRHRSPRAIEDRKTGGWRSQWPPTWGQDWCGAWREDDRVVVEVASATLYEGPEENDR